MDIKMTTKSKYSTKLSDYIRPRKLTDRVLDRLGGMFTGTITSVRVDRVKNRTTEKFERTPVLVFGDEYETYPSQEHRQQLRRVYGDDFDALIGKTVTIQKNGHGGTGRTLTCHDDAPKEDIGSEASPFEEVG